MALWHTRRAAMKTSERKLMINRCDGSHYHRSRELGRRGRIFKGPGRSDFELALKTRRHSRRSSVDNRLMRLMRSRLLSVGRATIHWAILVGLVDARRRRRVAQLGNRRSASRSQASRPRGVSTSRTVAVVVSSRHSTHRLQRRKARSSGRDPCLLFGGFLSSSVLSPAFRNSPCTSARRSRTHVSTPLRYRATHPAGIYSQTRPTEWLITF